MLTTSQRQKYLIVKLQRIVKFNAPSDRRQPTVWNAQVPRNDAGDPAVADLSCLHRDDVARMTPRQKAVCPDVENPKWWYDPEWWSDERPTASGEADPSPDPSPDPPPGPPPGPPPVAGITWYHGDPGPQCRPTGRGLGALPRDLSPLPRLTGAGQCGIPCNLDWYCDWWPSGLPPFYYDPKDPVRARVSLGRGRRCGRSALTKKAPCLEQSLLRPTQRRVSRKRRHQPRRHAVRRPTWLRRRPAHPPGTDREPAPFHDRKLPPFYASRRVSHRSHRTSYPARDSDPRPRLRRDVRRRRLRLGLQVDGRHAPQLWRLPGHGGGQPRPRAVGGALPRPAVVPGVRVRHRVRARPRGARQRGLHGRHGARRRARHPLQDVQDGQRRPRPQRAARLDGPVRGLVRGVAAAEGVSITLPRALLEKRVTTAIVFFGTNCPGFSFKQGRLEEDPKLAGKYRPS